MAAQVDDDLIGEPLLHIFFHFCAKRENEK
jgi:hypothetical protein